MKILVPTDFSKQAENAAQYAAKMAVKLKAELILLHVAYIDGPPHASMLRTQKIEECIMDSARQECITLMQRLVSDNKSLKASFNVILGYPVKDVVENFAVHNDITLVVMGTKGASGVKKIMIGSNAASVVGQCSVPVIIVPEHTRFKNIKNIAYASDLTSVVSEMKIIAPFAKLFNATVNIVHVLTPDSKKKIDKAKIKNDLIRKYQYRPISVHVVLDDDAGEGIDQYTGKFDTDILAMFTHKPSFFEKLFGKSATREMAFHTWLPLLSIKKPIVVKPARRTIPVHN
jgi:nucleotide-binding universal stress UspA family protein